MLGSIPVLAQEPRKEQRRNSKSGRTDHSYRCPGVGAFRLDNADLVREDRRCIVDSPKRPRHTANSAKSSDNRGRADLDDIHYGTRCGKDEI